MSDNTRDFITKYLHHGVTVELTDLHEYEDGSPLIGSLLLKGQNIFRKLNFGGPLLFHEDYLLAPMVRRSEDGEDVKFSVCAINLKTFQMAVNPDKFEQIELLRIQRNWIVFRESPSAERDSYIDMLWL